MLNYFAPAALALLIWWLSTGMMLFAVQRPRHTVPVNMTIMTVIAGAALIALFLVRDDTTVRSAYIGFASALAVWGWHEMSFLTGLVTGPRRTPCPGGSLEPRSTAAPFRQAAETVIYHELAIAGTAVLIGLLTFAPVNASATMGTVNTVGFWSFCILWLMRLSTKMNIYLGVRNLAESFLPAHLGYLKSYFCRRPMNGLFPVSITVSTVITAILAKMAFLDAQTDYEAVSLMLLATLLGLAVLEHWFLVLPFEAERMWHWGLNTRPPTAGPSPDYSFNAAQRSQSGGVTNTTEKSLTSAKPQTIVKPA